MVWVNYGTSWPLYELTDVQVDSGTGWRLTLWNGMTCLTEILFYNKSQTVYLIIKQLKHVFYMLVQLFYFLFLMFVSSRALLTHNMLNAMFFLYLFQLVGHEFDLVDDSQNTNFFETIYSLLDNISPMYRNTFSDTLIRKLQGLQDLQDQTEESWPECLLNTKCNSVELVMVNKCLLCVINVCQ